MFTLIYIPILIALFITIASVDGVKDTLKENYIVFVLALFVAVSMDLITLLVS